MGILLRFAEKSDMGEVLDLIKELASFEKEEHAVELSEEDLVRDGFGESPRFRVLLAEENDEILGGQVGGVRSRGAIPRSGSNRGVGGALYAEVMKYALEQGIKRVSWEVLDWNKVAIDFYESTGARILTGWQVVHMDEMSLTTYVKTN